jgi:hypothetical protein
VPSGAVIVAADQNRRRLRRESAIRRPTGSCEAGASDDADDGAVPHILALQNFNKFGGTDDLDADVHRYVCPVKDRRGAIAFIAASPLAGTSLQDCVRITVYVSDLHRYAPMVDKAQAELWGKPPYPPRTMIEVQRLFDDDIVEVDSVFYAPTRK